MAILDLTKDTFDKEVYESDKPVLVDFWASWCGPCKMLSPIITSVAEEIGEDAKICKVNVDDEQELAQKFGIMTIPTMVFFKDGKEVDKVVGIRQKAEIISKLK